MELLKIEFVRGEPSVLRVQGEADCSTADQLREALNEAQSDDPTVVIDMAGVTFIDAAGLRVVLETAESRNGVGPLTLVNASRVAWLLEVVGLSDLPSIAMSDGEDAGDR